MISTRRILLCSALAILFAVSAPADDAPSLASSWPRTFATPEGIQVTIYQPQPDSLRGDLLYGRAAAAVQTKGQSEPVFGAFWFEATLNTDRDQHVAFVESVRVPALRFPGASDATVTAVKDLFEKRTADWDLDMSLEELTSAMAASESSATRDAQLSNDPPVILYRSQPAILVVIDGEPALRAIPGSKVQRVINTAFLLGYDPDGHTYYLNAGKSDAWFATGDLKGGWRPIHSAPVDLVKIYQDQQKNAPPDTSGTRDPRTPEVLVATRPSELIVTDGPPKYAPIVSDSLLYVTNTETPLFKEVASQDFYVVLSGRWFRARSLSGPWTWVANDALPPVFAHVPEASARGEVLSYVAGTPQADEARVDADVPQTAAVERSKAQLTVTYDGDPRFEPIPGTDIQYAKNASAEVLLIRGRYYACSAAIWFASDDPRGPWALADSVPDQDIAQIPPQCPVYNVKYVTIYQSTPDVVYVGYLPGYAGCYPYHGAIVYGTGYYYRPWVGPIYYYPPPVTYGFHAYYNPYFGWSFGMSWIAGWGFVHVGWGGWYRPVAPIFRPPYYRPPGYYPVGYRPPGYRYPVYPGYRPPGHPGYPGYVPPGGYPRPTPYPGRPGQLPVGRNIYYRGPHSGAVRPAQPIAAAPSMRPSPLPYSGGGSPAAHPTTLPYGGGSAPAVRTTSGMGAANPTARPQPANNIYADRSGNVYRRSSDGQWQQNRGGNWQSAPGAQPSRGAMNHQAQARDRGAERSGVGGNAQKASGHKGGAKGGRPH